jgi:signal transduction histidine kinase
MGRGWALGVALTSLALVSALAGAKWGPVPRLEAPVDQALVLALTFVPVGLFLLRHRPTHRLSGLVWLVGFGALVATAAVQWSGTALGAFVTQWSWWPSIATIPVVLSLFPEGRPDGEGSGPRRAVARVAVAALVGGTALLLVAALRHPTDLLTTAVVKPPLVRGLLAGVVVCATAALVAALLSVVSLVRRARASEGMQRRQFLALAPAGVLLPVGIALDAAGVRHGLAPVLVALPLGLGVAILQYGLDDLDLAVDRGVVSAVMMTTLVAVWSLILALGERFLPGRSFAVTVVGLALVTVGFDPIRRRVAGAVRRWLYGDRDEPDTVLLRLGERLGAVGDPVEVLVETARSIVRSLRVPRARIRLGTGEPPVYLADEGRPGVPTLPWPMIRGDRVLGTLEVSPRQLGGSFTTAEQTLLTEVARQAATAVEAYELTLALEDASASARLVRDEERDRLRRDLHDGLGPILAGSRMQLHALRVRAGGDVEVLVDQLAGDLSSASTAIRELIDGLRPTALDAGLVAAVEGICATVLPEHDVRVVVDGPPPAGLPPAIELAALRIVSEAVTNVAKHAAARSCVVTIRVGDELDVEVADDGGGVTGRRRGVGLDSMAARASVVGGSVAVTTGPAGTTVRAQLPIGGRGATVA